MNGLYTASQIKNWESSTNKITSNGKDYWLPARPLVMWTLVYRLKLAYMVFIGKYDALNWEDK